ncbi:MAG: nitrilase-related carbon-nitrogen hydrolase [Syntrophomonadaceae bacterium]|jgi:NAD+ synthase (glutamine-hydrolysing)
MRVTMAQINPTVGDLEGNFRLIARAVAQASQDSSDLVVFPELAITGYPPQDLLERPWFVEQAQGCLQKVLSLSEQHEGLGILIGTPTKAAEAGKSLYNSAVLLYRGAILAERHKSLLPSYDVFDETRYFAPARHNSPVPFKGWRLGISICEDAWNDPAFWPAQPPLPLRSHTGIGRGRSHCAHQPLRFTLSCRQGKAALPAD